MSTRGTCFGTFLKKRTTLWQSLVFVFVASMGVSGHLLSFPGAVRMPEGHGVSAVVQSASQIPVGYVLPAQLDAAISVKDAHVGEILEARIMQEVPLPERGKIKLNSRVKGSILAVTKDKDGTGVRITMQFNQLIDRGETLAIATSLRAMASYQAVREALTPRTETGAGSPAGWATTVQIGGDVRYGDGGVVRSRYKEKVGKGVLGGVLVYVKPNPKGGCEGSVGDDHPQALWVFSADACGVYDLKGVEMIHGGQSGEFILHFEKTDMKLQSGTGMLLRVVSRP